MPDPQATPSKPRVYIIPFIHPEAGELVMLRLNRHNACVLRRYYRARGQAMLEGTPEPLQPFQRVTVRDLRLQVWSLDCGLDTVLAGWEGLTDEEQGQLDRFLQSLGIGAEGLAAAAPATARG